LIEIPAKTALDQSSDVHFTLERVRREMQGLSHEQRQCLEMKIEGCSYEETAARTGLSIEAVKSHLQNGRRMLWIKMGEGRSQLR